MSDAPSLDALARLAAECLDGSERLSLGDVERICRGLVAAVDALRAEREARAQAERERGVYRDDAHRLAAANGRLVDEADAAQRGLRAAEAQRDALAAAARSHSRRRPSAARRSTHWVERWCRWPLRSYHSACQYGERARL